MATEANIKKRNSDDPNMVTRARVKRRNLDALANLTSSPKVQIGAGNTTHSQTTDRHTSNRQKTTAKHQPNISQTSSRQATLRLPEEVWSTILSHLGNTDLKIMCCVSKTCWLPSRILLWHCPELRTHIVTFEPRQRLGKLKALAKLAVPIKEISLSSHFEL